MSVGHNTRAEDALKAYHLSELMKSLEEVKSQNGKHSSYLSRLQAKGLDIKAMKEAIKIHTKGDPVETVAYLKELANCLRILGTPLESDQADLFAAPAISQTPEEKAKEQGFGAGALGQPMTDNPHDPGSDLGQTWISAWHEGQAARAEVAEQEAAEDEDESEEPEEDGEQMEIGDAA